MLGGVWASMILGHWYLVTPKLPEVPLVRFSRWLGWARGACSSSCSWSGSALGAGPAGTPAFAALVRAVGAVRLAAAARRARVPARRVAGPRSRRRGRRSMESATGLLYINVGTIAAGTILAAGLYFGAGLLV